MNKKTKQWTFRTLFIVAISYHIYSIIVWGFMDSFGLIGISPLVTKTLPYQIAEVAVIIVANVLNYTIKIALPVWFFYRGWIKN